MVQIEQQFIGADNQPTVNARDLHGFLGVGKMFAHWIQDRIAKYGFVENQDFIILAHMGKYSGRGQPKKEYHLTLDMAKELSMIERTPKGKEARQYFIACEKKMLEQQKQKPQEKMSLASIRTAFKQLVRMQQDFQIEKDFSQALLDAATVMKNEFGVEMERYVPMIAALKNTQSEQKITDLEILLESPQIRDHGNFAKIKIDLYNVPIHKRNFTNNREVTTFIIGKSYHELRRQREMEKAENRLTKVNNCIEYISEKWNVSAITTKRAARFFTAIERLEATGKKGKKAVGIIMTGAVKDAVTELPKVLKVTPDPFNDLAEGICAGMPKVQMILKRNDRQHV